MSFTAPIAARFSSLFAADQVRFYHDGKTRMLFNVTVNGGDTCHDVHPLALWLVVAGLHHADGNPESLCYYHRENSCTSFGAPRTGTPLDEAFRRMVVCLYEAKQGWGSFVDADPVGEAIAVLDGWTPTEAQIVALRRGWLASGFDFDRFCPDLPAHDG